MRPIALVLLVLALLFQLACTDRDSGPAPDSRVSGDNAFSGQVRALEKAERVEETVMDAFQRQRRGIEAQTR